MKINVGDVFKYLKYEKLPFIQGDSEYFEIVELDDPQAGINECIVKAVPEDFVYYIPADELLDPSIYVKIEKK